MKKAKLILVAASALLVASCNNTSSSSNSGDTPVDDYDVNWTPGPLAIKDAKQPTIKNPQGIYNNLGKIRATQNKSALPQSGEANILVVPVEFFDDASYEYNFTESLRSELNKTYFSFAGTTSTMCSVSNYYATSSFGALNLSGVVAPTVKLPDTFINYVYQSLYFSLEDVVSDIIDYVYDYLFERTETYYLKDFDSNDDGKIDAIVLDYGWYPREAYYGTDMYSYVYTLLTDATFFGSELESESPVNAITWGSARLSDLTGYDVDSHIAVSQIGTLIGLEDYSDTTGCTDGYYRAPLAHRDMMDGKIGDHNPFSKYQLGWIEPTKVAASDIQGSKTYTLKPYEEDGSVLMLSPEETGLYGEYLLVEYYTPTSLNHPDSLTSYPYNLYGNVGYKKNGVRVYKVDARLVEGTSSSDVSLADSDPDFDKELTLNNGKKVKAYYDYAYSNNGYNEYSDSGIFEEYALVEELSKKGFNRHMTDYTSSLSDDDMFLEGDCFGTEGDIEGFYTDFAFDGNGNGNLKLGLTFSVDSLTDEAATITVRRAE